MAITSNTSSDSGSFSLTFGDIIPSRSPRCVVCWTTGEVHKFDGEFYCEAHLGQRLVREERPEPGRPPEGKRHHQRMNCIGLD